MNAKQQYKRACQIARLVNRDLGLMRAIFGKEGIPQALVMPAFDADYALVGGHVWRSQSRWIKFHMGKFHKWGWEL